MSLADNFCEMVARTPDMPHATARFGAWLIGASRVQGGFPVEASLRQIRDGIDDSVAGIGARNETINAAIQWFSDRGYLTVETGRPSRAGYTTQRYTLHL